MKAVPKVPPPVAALVMAGGVLSTVTVKLGPAAGAVLPAVSVPVPAAMEIPKGPSPLISLRVTVRVVPEPDTASVPVGPGYDQEWFDISSRRMVSA